MSSSDGQRQADAWPEPAHYRRSMRREFSLYVSALIVALMSVTGYVFTQRYVATVTEGLVDNLLIQARSYAQAASKAIIAGERPDALMLNAFCTRLKGASASTYWAGVFGADGSVLAHTEVQRITSGGSLLQRSAGQYADQLRPDEALALTTDTIYVRVPIVEQAITVGHLQLASSAAWISEVRRESIITVAIITLFMLAIGIPITMILTRRKLRPVKLITDSLRNVDLESFSIDPPVHKSNELGFLADTLRVMGRRLNQAQSDRAEKERRDRELEIARDIQRQIQPRTLPQTERYQFSVVYQSAREVGGDYYDLIDLGNGQIVFIIADVSGKSLPGMLVMLMTRDLIRSTLATERRPAETLSILNRELRPNLQSGMFVTMFYGLLDTRTGRLIFASAGHNPLIRMSRGSSAVSQHKTRGYPLGLVPPQQFERRIETGDMTLAEGDWIVQYTDGLNEAKNADGEEFGMDRMGNLMQNCTANQPDEFASHVMAAHREFVAGAEPFDDITLLVLRWGAQGMTLAPSHEGETTHAK